MFLIKYFWIRYSAFDYFSIKNDIIEMRRVYRI